MKQISPTQKGLITGALMIIASVFSLYILKNPVESNFQFLVYLIFCAGIVWSLFTYSKTATEKKAFKDYFSTGFKTFIVVTLLMAVFTYVYFSSNTSFRDSKIAENSRLLILQGNHLPNEIEENTKQLKKMFMPLMISSAVFRYLILGSIITVIAGGFLSSKNKIAA
ncbi:MAG: DUF4199 domain-containing protein [Ferruginibacter sp.]